MYIEGINPRRVLEAADLSPPVNAGQPLPDAGGESLALGTRGRDQTGNSYILLQAAGALPLQGNVGVWDENFLFTPVASATLNIAGAPLAGNFGQPTAAGQRFWAVVEGMAPARANGAAVENALLSTTATAGAVDDGGVAGSWDIQGLQFMVAAGAPGSFQARYMNPHVNSDIN